MTMGKEVLIGVWRLTSAELRREDGTVHYPYGANPKGMLIYTASGKISVQVTGSERRHFKTDDIWEGTRDELRDAIETYNAHFGTYDVYWDEKYVVHHIEGALLPNWVGGDQVRYFKVDDETLELRTPRLQAGNHAGYAVLVWKKEPA